MTSHESSDFLTPLRPERIDALVSDWDLLKSIDFLSTGAHAIEDVGGAARWNDRAVLSDIGSVKAAKTVPGLRRVGK